MPTPRLECRSCKTKSENRAQVDKSTDGGVDLRKGCHVYKALAIVWLPLDNRRGLGQSRNKTNHHLVGEL